MRLRRGRASSCLAAVGALLACSGAARLRLFLHPPAAEERAPPRVRLRAGADERAPSGSSPATEELLALLQRPGAQEDVQEVVRGLLADPERRASFDATARRLGLAGEGREGEAAEGGASPAGPAGPAGPEDPLARLLAQPSALAEALREPEAAGELLGPLAGSALLEELREFGAEVLERLQLRRLGAGALVQVRGLQAQPELNDRVGGLAEPTPEEAEAFPGRRIVELRDGQRLALRPENLVLPRHGPGDAVTLDAEFGGAEEGLEGRAALVSQLTAEERELGFDRYGGRVVVDVLPLLPGGPVVHRLLMWPEHLRPRTFIPGDRVELANLEANAELNGKPATVVPATPEELTGRGEVAVTLNESGARLLVMTANLRLTGVAAPAPRGFG